MQIGARLISQANSPGELRKAEVQAPRADKLSGKMEEFKDLLVTGRNSAHDLAPKDPRKVVLSLPDQRAPRFASKSAQTAFQVARVLFPPLMLAASEVVVRPALQGVGEFDEQGRLSKFQVDQDGVRYQYQLDDQGMQKFESREWKILRVPNRLDPSFSLKESGQWRDSLEIGEAGGVKFQSSWDRHHFII